MSKQQQAEYVKSHGARCSYCQSDEIDATEANVDAGTISQRVECLACRKDWSDLYTLTEIITSEKRARAILSPAFSQGCKDAPLRALTGAATMLSEKQEADYIDSEGTRRAYCDSDEIQG